MQSSLLSGFQALASNERMYSIPDTERKPLDLVCEASEWDDLLRFARVVGAPQQPYRALHARLVTVERQLRLVLGTDSNALTYMYLRGRGPRRLRSDPVIVLVCFANFVPIVHQPVPCSLSVLGKLFSCQEYVIAPTGKRFSLFPARSKGRASRIWSKPGSA
jgi:hypothetical protein